MSSDFNQITVVGKLGRDPEFKDGGTWQRCSFSVGVTSVRKGEKKTNWFKVTAWGKLAGICADYLKKGNGVLVSGEVSLNEYKKKDGTNGAAMEINCNTMKILSQAQRNAASHDSEGDYAPSASGDDGM